MVQFKQLPILLHLLPYATGLHTFDTQRGLNLTQATANAEVGSLEGATLVIKAEDETHISNREKKAWAGLEKRNKTFKAKDKSKARPALAMACHHAYAVRLVGLVRMK